MSVELSTRARKILYAAVTEFIATGEPVGSRTLSRKYALDLSPATIRNVLSDLEEAGFLLQPHASAGRVPSERAFRVFIDALMQVREIAGDQRSAIEARFSALATDRPGVDIARETARLLSNLTGTVAVVVAPRIDSQTLRSIRFIPTRPGEMLAVLVTVNGSVENRFLRADVVPTGDDLQRIHNLLDDVLEGRTLRDVRELFARRLHEAESELGVLRHRAFTLGNAALAAPPARGSTLLGNDVVIEGQAQLLDKPEFADVERIKQLARLLDERELLVAMLDRTLDTEGVHIVLGGEVGDGGGDHHPGLDQLSIVGASYSLDASSRGGASGSGGPTGSVSILGPTRMDYPAIVPIVNETARAIGEFLARQLDEDGVERTTRDAPRDPTREVPRESRERS